MSARVTIWLVAGAMIVAGIGVVYWQGRAHERAQADAEAGKATTNQIEKRGRINEDVRTVPADDLCDELVGMPDGCP